MYHEQTREMIRARRRARLVAAGALLALVIATIVGYALYQRSTREQGALALRTAILDTANRCCAVEGAYPASLTYLEHNYGLVVNHDDYVVSYESLAGNVVPTVTVVTR